MLPRDISVTTRSFREIVPLLIYRVLRRTPRETSRAIYPAGFEAARKAAMLRFRRHGVISYTYVLSRVTARAMHRQRELSPRILGKISPDYGKRSNNVSRERSIPSRGCWALNAKPRELHSSRAVYDSARGLPAVALMDAPAVVTQVGADVISRLLAQRERKKRRIARHVPDKNHGALSHGASLLPSPFRRATRHPEDKPICRQLLRALSTWSRDSIFPRALSASVSVRVIAFNLPRLAA